LIGSNDPTGADGRERRDLAWHGVDALRRQRFEQRRPVRADVLHRAADHGDDHVVTQGTRRILVLRHRSSTGERRHRVGAGDPVDRQAVGLLEGAHRPIRLHAEDTVDAAGSKPAAASRFCSLRTAGPDMRRDRTSKAASASCIRAS